MLESIKYSDIKNRLLMWGEAEGFKLSHEDVFMFKKDDIEKVILFENSGGDELLMLGVKNDIYAKNSLVFSFGTESKIEYDESSTMLLVNGIMAINLNKFFEGN